MLKLKHNPDKIKIEIKKGELEFIDENKELKKYLEQYYHYLDGEDNIDIQSFLNSLNKIDKYLYLNFNYSNIKVNVIDGYITIKQNVKHNITTLNLKDNHDLYIYELMYINPSFFTKKMNVLSYLYSKNMNILNILKEKYKWNFSNYCYNRTSEKINNDIENVIFKDIRNVTNLPKKKISNNYDLIYINVMHNVMQNIYKIMNISINSQSHNNINLYLLMQFLPKLKNNGKMLITFHGLINKASFNLIMYLNTIFKDINIYYSSFGIAKQYLFIFGTGFLKNRYDSNPIVINDLNIQNMKYIEIDTKIDNKLFNYTIKHYKKKLNYKYLFIKLNNILSTIPVNTKILLIKEYFYLDYAIKWCIKYNIPIKYIYEKLHNDSLIKMTDLIFGNKMKIYNIINLSDTLQILFNDNIIKYINECINFIKYIERNKKYKKICLEIDLLQIVKKYAINIGSISSKLFKTEQINKKIKNDSSNKIYIIDNIKDDIKDDNIIIILNIDILINNIDILCNKLQNYNDISLITSNFIHEPFTIYILVTDKSNIINVNLRHQLFSEIHNILNKKVMLYFSKFILRNKNIDELYIKYKMMK